MSLKACVSLEPYTSLICLAMSSCSLRWNQGNNPGHLHCDRLDIREAASDGKKSLE